VQKILHFLKIFGLYLFLYLIFIFFIEIIFGNWFKNNFSLRLSSERNINRAYTFDFTNHKGYSHYIRDNYAFRVKDKDTNIKEVDIIFAGGSTTNQKFLNYEDTFVGQLQEKFINLNLINSGIDGMSIIGHINSFNLWFDKIDDLKPKYYVYYIGLNDSSLLDNKQIKSVDELTESNMSSKIREYLEANSFFYKRFRVVKTNLFLKYNFKKGANIVNGKTVVYGERKSADFITYDDFEKINSPNKKFQKIYTSYLEKLTNEVRKRNSKIIYVTQTTGNGMTEKYFSIATSIIDHCNKFNLKCFNLAKELDLSYNDFYDWAHLNVNGSKKVGNYLFKELNKAIN
tara:strand:- start:135 stop:1163 length:1029 start_codon:yes stop_codon:yes gene_type:complete